MIIGQTHTSNRFPSRKSPNHKELRCNIPKFNRFLELNSNIQENHRLSVKPILSVRMNEFAELNDQDVRRLNLTVLYENRICTSIPIAGLGICLTIDGRRQSASSLKDIRHDIDCQPEAVGTGHLGSVHLASLHKI